MNIAYTHPLRISGQQEIYQVHDVRGWGKVISFIYTICCIISLSLAFYYQFLLQSQSKKALLLLCCGIFFFCGSIFHILWTHRPIVTWYEEEVNQGTNRFRWIEYGFTSPLMIVTIAILVGATTVSELAIIYLVHSVTFILVGLAENTLHYKKFRLGIGLLSISTLTYIWVWTKVFGINLIGVRLPVISEHLLNAGIVFFVYLIFPIIFALSMTKIGQSNYSEIDKLYNTLGVATKILVLVIILFL